jgi:alkanesulfonate monooxygenase SsuD/methylene tetrahydromethanopterin reductase-like flavin-dependent oxidoreductase (luciferase family)
VFTAAELSSAALGTIEDWEATATALDHAGVGAVLVTDPLSLPVVPGPPPRFDPVTVATVMASVTGRLGVVAAETAVHGFPYHVARRLATLDHVAAGRIGWLPRVTDAPSERDAFEFRATDAADEPDRAAEFLDIVLGLWDTWEPGAERPDQASGEFKDDSRITPLDYVTERFRVAGPLDTPRTPQGRPAVVMTVTDAADLPLAARFADVLVLGAPCEGDLTTLVAAAASATASRASEVRLMARITDTDRPGALTVGRDGAAASATAVRLGETLHLAGIVAVGDGTPGWLDWFTTGLVPTLGGGPNLQTVPNTTTLLAGLGLETAARHGRKAA